MTRLIRKKSWIYLPGCLSRVLIPAAGVKTTDIMPNTIWLSQGLCKYTPWMVKPSSLIPCPERKSRSESFVWWKPDIKVTPQVLIEPQVLDPEIWIAIATEINHPEAMNHAKEVLPLSTLERPERTTFRVIRVTSLSVGSGVGCGTLAFCLIWKFVVLIHEKFTCLRAYQPSSMSPLFNTVGALQTN